MLWEYRSINASAEGFSGLKFDLKGFTTRFNELGAQGWELVSGFDTSRGACGSTDRIVTMSKRPKV